MLHCSEQIWTSPQNFINTSCIYSSVVRLNQPITIMIVLTLYTQYDRNN